MILLLSLHLLLLCCLNLFSIVDKFVINHQGFILGFIPILLALFSPCLIMNKGCVFFLRALEVEDKLTEE